MTDHARWTRPERGSGRVLFPPAADPLEYLMGLVLKAASDNIHMNVGAILAAAGYPHARSFDLALSRLDSLDRLAEVLGIEHAMLKGLAFTTVHSTKALTTVSFLGGKASSFDIVTRRRRLSGETLLRQPFHRAVWTHGLLPYCPSSLELLVDRCPGCGDPLDWYRATLASEPTRRLEDVNAIFRCAEPDCGLDLRDLPSPKLPDSVAMSYRRMAALAAPADRHDDRRDLHPALHALPAGACFELGWCLARAFADDAVPRARCKQLPAETIAQTLQLAEGFLSGWPDRLLEALASDARDVTAEQMTRRLRSCRALAGSKATWPELAKLFRSTYPKLMRRDREALRFLNPAVVTRTEAVEIAGMHTASFARAAMSSGLNARFSSGTRRVFQDFDIGEIERLRDAKDGSIPVDAVVERLGISYHGVEQLVVLGLLEAEGHAALPSVYRLSRITLRSLDDLIAELVAASRLEDIDQQLPLRIAVKSIRGEKPWGAIVGALLDGALPFRLDVGVRRVFRGIMIAPADVDLLRSFSFDRAEHPDFPFVRDMSRRDVEEALNLVPGTLQEALDQELGPARSRGRIPVVDVEAIARRMISAAEISARTWPGTRRLPRALTRSRHRRLGAAGWLRSDVEPLLGTSL